LHQSKAYLKGDSGFIGPKRTGILGETGPPHGRGVLPGAKVGNGVAVGAGVAVAAGLGVAICACTLEKKVIKPTHTPTKAIPNRIRLLVAEYRSSMDVLFITEASTK
jgi:hypothetical protein